MLVNIFGARCTGIVAAPVTVEVDIVPGIGIHLVGLADAAVKESLMRTITALQSMGYRIPGKKIVINLAPADMHKKGSGYDIPIAIGILTASGQISAPDPEKFVIMGELGLNGSARKIPGALPIVEMAAEQGFKGCILPAESALEVTEYENFPVYAAENLEQVIKILSEEKKCTGMLARNRAVKIPENSGKENRYMDFSEIKGQVMAKRGMEIAAAGGHNIILIGPPGGGKSTLANALAGILPPMTQEEALTTSKIHSVAGKETKGGLVRTRPFRAVGCSTSITALTGGGGDFIIPGEISLAHNGVLFMDEFCEIPKRTIEALRSPLEERSITITRLHSRAEFPASFMLVAATNPCPCGYYGDGNRCTCSPGRRYAYLSKLSGPIMDRIDIHLWVPALSPEELTDTAQAETTAAVAKRVAAARQIQTDRFSREGIFTNSEMKVKEIKKYCRMTVEGQIFMKKAADSMSLSARAYHKILKIARTVADMAQEEEISPEHLSEAARYRFLDKKNLVF